MLVMVNGLKSKKFLFVSDIEQLSRLHAYGEEIYREAATNTKSGWSPLVGADTRSMTSILTHQPPLFDVMEHNQEGESDRVCIKYQRDDGHCWLFSLAELAGLPCFIVELIFAAIKKKIGAKHYGFRHISHIFNTVGVSITSNNLEFLDGADDKLARIMEQNKGRPCLL